QTGVSVSLHPPRPPPTPPLFPYTTLFRSPTQRPGAQPRGPYCRTDLSLQYREHVAGGILEPGDRRPLIAHDSALVLVESLVALRSEEHTSELQSQSNLVCRLLLEKKKKRN